MRPDWYPPFATLLTLHNSLNLGVVVVVTFHLPKLSIFIISTKLDIFNLSNIITGSLLFCPFFRGSLARGYLVLYRILAATCQTLGVELRNPWLCVSLDGIYVECTLCGGRKWEKCTSLPLAPHTLAFASQLFLVFH